MADSANIFISHVHEDDKRVGELTQLIVDHGYTVRDASVTIENPNEAFSPDYIKGQILGPKIDWAGTVLVLVSSGMRESEFVNWEIEFAAKKDKQIVGVWDDGADESDMPDALKEYADAMVDWDGEKIADALKGERSWESSDGTGRAERELVRHGC